MDLWFRSELLLDERKIATFLGSNTHYCTGLATTEEEAPRGFSCWGLPTFGIWAQYPMLHSSWWGVFKPGVSKSNVQNSLKTVHLCCFPQCSIDATNSWHASIHPLPCHMNRIHLTVYFHSQSFQGEVREGGLPLSSLFWSSCEIKVIWWTLILIPFAGFIS